MVIAERCLFCSGCFPVFSMCLAIEHSLILKLGKNRVFQSFSNSKSESSPSPRRLGRRPGAGCFAVIPSIAHTLHGHILRSESGGSER